MEDLIITPMYYVHWRNRGLKESAYMLGFGGLRSRPSIEINSG